MKEGTNEQKGDNERGRKIYNENDNKVTKGPRGREKHRLTVAGSGQG